MTPPRHLTRETGAQPSPSVWLDRRRLELRQQALLRRSAALRGELGAEMRAGWQQIEAPVDLALRLRDLVSELHRHFSKLRERHPVLTSTAVLWLPWIRLVWRRLRGNSEGSATTPGNTQRHSRLRRLVGTWRWIRIGLRIARLFGVPASRRRPSA
jgi:hypothetical protein